MIHSVSDGLVVVLLLVLEHVLPVNAVSVFDSLQYSRVLVLELLDFMLEVLKLAV